MQFRTTVNLPASFITLTPQQRVLFFGSCFADHIGQLMAESLPEEQVVVNPNGTLYNPVSIGNALARLVRDDGVDEHGLFEADNGLWKHWDYTTKFSAPSRTVLYEQLSDRWRQHREALLRTDVLFVTFSTNHVYALHAGRQVANCHKQPARLFTERALTADEMFGPWQTLLEQLFQTVPSIKVVLTLSPYRYAKYGMHGNALAKAQLLLLIDSLCCYFAGRVGYFPAYEIVTDELRDYRFYKTDMLHPSDQAVDYVWEQFQAWCFTPELTQCAKERRAALKRLQHRQIR